MYVHILNNLFLSLNHILYFSICYSFSHFFSLYICTLYFFWFQSLFLHCSIKFKPIFSLLEIYSFLSLYIFRLLRLSHTLPDSSVILASFEIRFKNETSIFSQLWFLITFCLTAFSLCNFWQLLWLSEGERYIVRKERERERGWI